MVSRYMLLHLPIHKRPRDMYYAAHSVHEAKAHADAEKVWGKPFASLSREVQVQTDEEAFWPPWFFNDIRGFLEIGPDGGSNLVGGLYLKRKYFYRSSRHRRSGRFPEIVYYAEITKWLGHASTQTTDIYLQADPTEKLETPPALRPGKFRPPDRLIATLRASTVMRSSDAVNS